MTDKKRITIEIPVSDDVCIDQECRGGHPRVGKGRFPVSQILAELVDREDGIEGEAVKELAADYDYPVEAFKAALTWAAQVLDQDFTRTNVDLGVILEETWVVKDKTTGWWWRPRAMGYTQELLAAGVVDEAEATSWAHRRSPDRNGNYTDEAMTLETAIESIGEGTVFHEILDRITPEPYPWCSECEVEVQRVDEDGCCVSCGTDVFHDEDGNPVNGRDRKIDELKREIIALSDESALLSQLEDAKIEIETLTRHGERLREELEAAKGAAEEIRDAWVPKEKHTEFPWEIS